MTGPDSEALVAAQQRAIEDLIAVFHALQTTLNEVVRRVELLERGERPSGAERR
jgi:hypothetical protein